MTSQQSKERSKSPEAKAKWAAEMRAYRKRRPEVFRKIDIKKKFNLDWDVYQEMLKVSNGLCEICKQPETKLDYRTKNILNLSVDHDHDTKQIRGLLCMDCNRAIGMLQDSPEMLMSAFVYLQKYKSMM